MPTLPIETNVFYRYIDSAQHGVDEWGDLIGVYKINITCHKYSILSKTPKGTWIRADNTKGKRFILDDARKKWAHPTKTAALTSFIRRKECQVSILTAQLKQAEHALKKAKNNTIIELAKR